MSRLVIRNTTQYPDDEVARLVRFAMRELHLPSRFSVLIRVSHTRINRRRLADPKKYVYGASGRAHNYVYRKPDVPDGAAYEVHLRVSRPELFPCDWNDRYADDNVRIGELADWREALVCIAAHEGKHIEQYQLERNRGRTTAKQRRRVLSGIAEEMRCEAEAKAALARYRATTG